MKLKNKTFDLASENYPSQIAVTWLSNGSHDCDGLFTPRGMASYQKQKEKWITIGENDGPAHMHINSEIVDSAEFVEEEKPERTSFSVCFFNKDKERVLAAFFTKMYDESKTLISERQKVYDELKQKYSSKIQF